MSDVINQWEQPGYIVSGIHRSGTSMMMWALGQSLPVYWYPRQNEKLFQPHEDQRCYEPPECDHQSDSFPWHPLYAGLLVKCFANQIRNLCKDDPAHVANARTHNVLYMTRDYDAIALSQFKAFGQDMNITTEKYWELVEEDIVALNKQPNVELTVMKYEEVVKAPLHHFEVLKERGWPIDPEKCAAIVKPNVREQVAA
jgi:hypothetical protein